MRHKLAAALRRRHGCKTCLRSASGLAFSASGQEQEREQQPEHDRPSRQWYRAAYARLLRVSCSLQNVDRVDGRLRHAMTGNVVTDTRAVAQMADFVSLAEHFVVSRSPLQPVVLNSLTRVCNLLGVSAQRRKSVRLTVFRQVTQHHVWRGTLEEMLRDLQSDIASLDHQSPAAQMAEQIASACMHFLSDTGDASTSVSPSWMRPAPLKKPQEPPQARKWEEVLEMFVDLAKCLEPETRLAGHATKIESMKEGLYQIRDIVIERDISFKEARRQDCLVQKKLSKSLGHSSKCLFMLLVYYLYGSVEDIELQVCKGVSGKADKNVSLHAAKILTDGDERTVKSGIKKLSRALGVLRFVWEAASTGTGTGTGTGTDGALELQGHLWGLGVQERMVMYRGDAFYVHRIRLR